MKNREIKALEGKVIYIEDELPKNYTVFVSYKFSKKLLGFLSTETEDNDLVFTSEKEKLLLVNKYRAKQIIDIIYEEDSFLIRGMNVESNEKKIFSSDHIQFDIAEVEFS